MVSVNLHRKFEIVRCFSLLEMDVLESRLERMERCIFGNLYNGSTAVLSLPPLTSTTDIATRLHKLQTTLPAPAGFPKVYEQYKTLGLANDLDVRKLLAAPLDMQLKIDLIVANTKALRQMSLQAETILSLKDFISGDAWCRARDALPQLVQTEAEMAKLLTLSSDLMTRVDTSLEHYDRSVGIVSEKMLLF